jgi:hypothetical protein
MIEVRNSSIGSSSMRGKGRTFDLLLKEFDGLANLGDGLIEFRSLDLLTGAFRRRDDVVAGDGENVGGNGFDLCREDVNDPFQFVHGLVEPLDIQLLGPYSKDFEHIDLRVARFERAGDVDGLGHITHLLAHGGGRLGRRRLALSGLSRLTADN